MTTRLCFAPPLGGGSKPSQKENEFLEGFWGVLRSPFSSQVFWKQRKSFLRKQRHAQNFSLTPSNTVRDQKCKRRSFKGVQRSRVPLVIAVVVVDYRLAASLSGPRLSQQPEPGHLRMRYAMAISHHSLNNQRYFLREQIIRKLSKDVSKRGLISCFKTGHFFRCFLDSSSKSLRHGEKSIFINTTEAQFQSWILQIQQKTGTHPEFRRGVEFWKKSELQNTMAKVVFLC